MTTLMIIGLSVVGYLIVGFLTNFVATYFQESSPDDSEFWMLTFIWPLALIVGAGVGIKNIFENSLEKVSKLKNKRIARKEKIEDQKEMKKRQKKLTVLVCGFAGTGKSTIARKIEEALAADGVPVDRIPDDDESACWDDETLNKKFKALIDGGFEVVVKTVQIKRPVVNAEIEESDLEKDVQEEILKVKEIAEDSKLYEGQGN